MFKMSYFALFPPLPEVFGTGLCPKAFIVADIGVSIYICESPPASLDIKFQNSTFDLRDY